MPEQKLKTYEVMTLNQGLQSLGNLASAELPKEGIPEGDLKEARKIRSKLRMQAAMAITKLLFVTETYGKQQNELAIAYAEMKDGKPVMAEVPLPDGSKRQMTRLDPAKAKQFREEMQAKDELEVNIPNLGQPFTEQDFEAAILLVPADVLVQLAVGKMVLFSET